MKTDYDVIIIGGGMAGLPLALILARQGKKVACIDRDDPKIQATEKFDGRTVAISAGGAEIMEKANVWEKILTEACPINEIKITTIKAGKIRFTRRLKKSVKLNFPLSSCSNIWLVIKKPLIKKKKSTPTNPPFSQAGNA